MLGRATPKQAPAPTTAACRHISGPSPPHHFQAGSNTRCITCHQPRVNHHRHQYANKRPQRFLIAKLKLDKGVKLASRTFPNKAKHTNLA
jgi:hypothetical protein